MNRRDIWPSDETRETTTPQIVIPEPEGIPCTTIYFLDSPVGHQVAGEPQDVAVLLDEFRAGAAPWLVLYEPVWQKPCIINRNALDKVMSVVAGFVLTGGRPDSTRKEIVTPRGWDGRK